jgi:hypothetical protein
MRLRTNYSTFKYSALKYSEIRIPNSEIKWEADELLTITVASINTARGKENK